MTFKDLFSNHAQDYQKYRPSYPAELFKFLSKQAPQLDTAWDCGTGNGQGVHQIAEYFNTVHATDPSQKQLDQAFAKSNIIYQCARAEDCPLADNSVDLVIVFQALHLFNLKKFFNEVKRVIKPKGILAVVGYDTALTGVEKIDEAYKAFCFDFLWEKKCWDMERSSLNENYQHIAFPYNAIEAPSFHIKMSWNFEDYLAYINTWSAVKNYTKRFHENPVETFIKPKIETLWPTNKETKVIVSFPLILKLGYFD